jgi:alpha-tubulin suppressor-like RCC1 family protein
MILAGLIGSLSLTASKFSNKLYAWGLNSLSRLGTGDTTTRTSPTIIGTDTIWKYVGSTALSSLAIKNNGTLWAWGGNGNGNWGWVTLHPDLVLLKLDPILIGSM